MRRKKKEIDAATIKPAKSGTNNSTDEDKDATNEKESRSAVAAIGSHDENVFKDSLGRKKKLEAPQEIIVEAADVDRVTRGRAAKRIALSKISGR